MDLECNERKELDRASEELQARVSDSLTVRASSVLLLRCPPAGGCGLVPISEYCAAAPESKPTDSFVPQSSMSLSRYLPLMIVRRGILYLVAPILISLSFFIGILVIELKTIAAYKYQGMSTAAEEVASLMFYEVMFYVVRPVERIGVVGRSTCRFYMMLSRGLCSNRGLVIKLP